MSQLDMSISFYHIVGLILCFYIFVHLVLIILTKYLYNNKIRLNDVSLENFLGNKDNLNFIKRILKV